MIVRHGFLVAQAGPGHQGVLNMQIETNPPH